MDHQRQIIGEHDRNTRTTAADRIDDFIRDHRTAWDGVTNAQAVGAIRSMHPGDRVFIYHSGGLSSVVGLAEVKSEPRDDPKNPKSAVVDLEFIGRLEPPTTLTAI